MQPGKLHFHAEHIYIYVLVIPQYEYNILVITQVRGKAEDAGDN